MSGPKGGGYTVETAQAREARAYAAALASYEQTRTAVARLRIEALAARSSFGPSVPVPVEMCGGRVAGRSSTEVLAADEAGRAALRTAEKALHAAASTLGRQRWQQRSGSAVIDDRQFASATDQVRTRAAADRSPAVTDRWLADGLAQLAEIAAAWPVDASTTVLDAATDEVRAAGGPSGAALGVSRARDELRRLRATQRIEQERRTESDRLRAEIESVRDWQDPDATAELVALLDARLADPADLTGLVQAFVAEAHARRDREEASAILADVLVEMGYRLGEGFATRLGETTDVLVGHPGWSQHAVSVRLDGAGRIFTHVVRAADASSETDARVDAEFCTDFDKIAARAGRRGLVLNSVRRFPPGERECRAVDGDRVRQVAASVAQAAPRERAR